MNNLISITVQNQIQMRAVTTAYIFRDKQKNNRIEKKINFAWKTTICRLSKEY